MSWAAYVEDAVSALQLRSDARVIDVDAEPLADEPGCLLMRVRFSTGQTSQAELQVAGWCEEAREALEAECRTLFAREIAWRQCLH